jgi:hypothetical protein
MLNTDSMNFVDCPKCHQPAVNLCTYHRGKKLSITQPERVADYSRKFADRVGLYKDGPDRVEKVLAYNRKLAGH